MANEQQRAQRIQSDFQKLLTELKNQDEQIAELSARHELDDSSGETAVPGALEDYFDAHVPEKAPIHNTAPHLALTAIRG